MLREPGFRGQLGLIWNRGEANPTMSVLLRVARALGVSIEELVQAPRAECRFYKAGSLPRQRKGGAQIQALLPESITGLQIEKLELDEQGGLTGVPHIPGSREYLVCNSGHIELAVAGEKWQLASGDVLVFRGDQKHSYKNIGLHKASAYSVIVWKKAK